MSSIWVHNDVKLPWNKVLEDNLIFKLYVFIRLSSTYYNYILIKMKMELQMIRSNDSKNNEKKMTI